MSNTDLTGMGVPTFSPNSLIRMRKAGRERERGIMGKPTCNTPLVP
jgi:hypothetical protein